MNARKHRRAAKECLREAEQWMLDESDPVNAAAAAAIAQVHATLATGRAKGKLLPFVEEQTENSVDWNTQQITEQVLRWFASIDDQNGYWSTSMHRYVSLCVDSAEAVAYMADQLGVEVQERPQPNGTVHFNAVGSVHGWQVTATYIKRAPKVEPPTDPFYSILRVASGQVGTAEATS